MSLPWFRMYAEFATDPKIQVISFDDQRHFIVLLCLKCNGTLDSYTGSDAFRERMIALGLKLSEKGAEEVKARLLEAGLIDTNWQPIAWQRRQPRSDLDPSNAERQRRWRQRQANQGVVDRNVTVTGIDLDIDKNIDKNIDKSQSGLKAVSRAEELRTFLASSPKVIKESRR